MEKTIVPGKKHQKAIARRARSGPHHSSASCPTRIVATPPLTIDTSRPAPKYPSACASTHITIGYSGMNPSVVYEPAW